ncbi:ubiquitin carboxyl-terminal hydrolase puf isoform X2 [Amyelois transitella]|uniref:ubiquitin carboxyl-terminal hydrolase puf isoform X2 n=1 Tax=Amyelois transitella TaxID=680683 RepID=UPI00298FE1DC|nr:ubiquitin carboxyl-terminal hydrolase puf isoform X2 [Amyelois transitella]
MCDVCSEFSQLLVNCEARLTDDVSQYPSISQSELETVLNYIISWPQRQCMCCYRDVKNFERFYLVVQSILCLSVCQLKQLKDDLVEASKSSAGDVKECTKPPEPANVNENDDNNDKQIEAPREPQKPINTGQQEQTEEKTESPSTSAEETEVWPIQQKEKLMHIVSKIFLLNFPLYLACKHSTLPTRLDDLSAQEISNLSSYCDLHDTEIPAYLLRNVSLFCKLGGVFAMTSVFEQATPSSLPLSMAHAIVAAVGNLKLWLNFRAVAQLFMPLRSKILQYMCSLEDKDLRVPAVKSMADFMWGAAKEPLDAPLAFDGDGLALAFKYFNSSTLTMRLAGVAQINAHIAAHNELCAGEPAAEAEVAGQRLASWLTYNNIIEHLFGPNLHVEVIKQSHMILKFLAVEGRVTIEHIELIWAAAQLKHCGRQVYDLLPGFIRALAPKPCSHLYSLLCALPPKEHTEQSLYLASALMRAMWSRGSGGGATLSTPPPLEDAALRQPQPPCKPHHNSSSEASVSMDQTNSDDDPCEELSTSGEDAGPTPRKQSKHQRELTEQEWLREGEELSKKECATLKSCQKRSKRAGSSGSASSGAEELLRPRKKKLYKKRHKPPKPRHFQSQLKTAELAESVSEVEEESSGSDTHCQILCDNVDARRLMELRLMESYKRRGVVGAIGVEGEEEEGSASSALSPHSHPHLADLDEDDSACEEELARLAAQAQSLTEYRAAHGLAAGGRALERGARPPSPAEDACRPADTLLWQLLQDGNIEQLGEGLALEAEKALCGLLCFSTDKFIRIKFIEGCLDNLANHRSVAVSLRLLPKLFSSFQQLRGMDMHQVVMWAERERGMMRLFLEDLRHYMAKAGAIGGAGAGVNLDAVHYAHITELTVRLHFLTAIFSPVGSPQHFRLTVEQVEELWQCLVVKGGGECADCLYSWLLSHTKSPEQHALGLDALRFLYVEKMPTLDPETISIMGLSLYQQLCNLARMALGAGDSRDSAHPHTLAMDHLWKIALRANSTDVSMGAIQYLNSYYMGQQLQQEDDFVSKCMFHLSSAAERLISKEQDEEGSSSASGTEKKETDKPTDRQNIYEHMTEEAALQCIQRALLLLKTHLDTFKRRYAYHLRRWALAESGAWEGAGGGAGCVRLTLQPAGAGPRATLSLHQSDLVAHLRAHVHVWWEKQIQGEEGVTALSTDGPLRMITQGQELTIDYDERTLYDMGFKDNQLVFVSVGVTGRGAWAEWPSAQPAPARARLPTLLLLDPTYFHHLFTLMQALGRMKEPGSTGEPVAHTKAQLLSRRVWDILQAVPLNPTLLEAFQNPTESKLPELLDPTSPQKLMYSLHIIDKLSSTNTGSNVKEPSIITEKKEDDKILVDNWNETFIKKGGLRILYDIMMSGILQRSDDSEWRQDCLALLLQLLCRIGTLPTSDPAQTPKLHPSLLSLMSVEETTERLISILCEAATPKEPATYKTGFWGRAQVVQHAMRMCVWWARGGGDAAALAWALRRAAPRLLLDDADPAVRREAGSALYRLCAGGECGVVAPLLQLLLAHLPRAADMRQMTHEHVMHHHAEEGKEPYGPACRDYFWLVCRLIDGLPEDFFKEGATSEDSGAPDLNELCEQIRSSLEKREIIERRAEPCTPDDGLYGQLSLLTHLLKHPLRFKTSEQGTRTLEMVFGFLFDVPNPEQRNLPKCKSQKSRAAAYDLLVELVRGAPDNYMVLHHKLMEHHKPGPQSSYPWDYWPAEESRSECGYVGLTNLGATCYMASCMQHLYMMPAARAAVLAADPTDTTHAHTLQEMQRMFAYLMESERKAYNPRSFCKVYQMDHQPLNTGEQKDMAEFFIDLVSKLEEMTPELKKLVKTLFCGVLSNNVVSLDCPHVSRTLEEFYTVRCQVADMRNLHQSLDEVTVKDTLEGDNCYTCSQCAAKVRAEKRACFKKLPRILCFNTMRYTFNMLTMLKEKVNTHFSFPMRLDMSGYVEKHLMPAQYQEEKLKSAEGKKEGEGSPSGEAEDNSEFEEHYEYELIGVTVHTGTADGGHYYSFIRDREHDHPDRWLLFNDAEVKPFDPAHIAAECFGGEMTSKTYDSVTEKFMDFSFEKTNSAYMLFYELAPPRSQRGSDSGQQEEAQSSRAEESPSSAVDRRVDAGRSVQIPPDLLKWIWDDNMQFLHDKNIFQHAYFTFMGQMCSSVPQSLLTLRPEITEVAARLSTSFFIETFIHAKEKPTMVSWVELVTKQFNASAAASEWFLGHMADDTWWPMQVLIKCPNQMVRQMFQRLCMHVIQRLRSSHCALYLQGSEDGEDNSKLGEASCVTRFIRMLLSLMENGARSHLRHLTEYFSLLYEFSKMGEEEGKFMLRVNAIASMVDFYLGQNSTTVESPTEEASGSGSGSGSGTTESAGDKLRPGALDKMVALVAGLVERSRDAQGVLALHEPDARALLHAKSQPDLCVQGFPFIYQQTRDCLNLQQTRSLIFALCRWNEPLAQKIVNMIFQAIAKHSETCGAFFKLLTLLAEGSGGGAGAPAGLPCFTQLVLARLWDVADVCVHAALEWIALQVPRNKAAHAWALRTADRWVEPHLLAASAARVRAAAALLLVALVPSQHFRAGYARTRQPHHSHHAHHLAKLPDTAHHTLHQVYTMLLGKLKAARKYTDIAVHGTVKLTAYFGVMSYCVVSRVEKLMFGQYFNDLWDLYHPAISEPSVAVHPNKQALLTFWHAVCLDCPENVQLAVSNPRVIKHIAFNYILADHDDGSVVAYNRAMLPPYYALLRLCCRRSSAFARALAQHQNIHWAFRNIAPHAHLYQAAADELLRLARVLAARGGGGGGSSGSSADSTDAREAAAFRRSTLSAYLQGLNGRTCWTTLISAFCTLVENEDDRLYVVYNGGLQMTFEALHSLHAVYVEGGGASGGGAGSAGAGGAVRGELIAALRWARALCRTLRIRRDAKEARALLLACKDWPECARRLLTMLTLHHRLAHLRRAALGVLRELVMIGGSAALGALVPLAAGAHCAARGVGGAAAGARGSPRSRAHLHLCARQMNAPAPPLAPVYRPYHKFIDTCCRVARSQRCMSEQLVLLSALCALEAIPLRFNYFAAFWNEVAACPADSKLEEMLLECSVVSEYVDAVLLDERDSLEDPVIYQFMRHYYPKLGGGGSAASAAEALAAEVARGAERGGVGALLAPLRALLVLCARAPAPPAALAAARAVLQRLQRAPEEETSEPETASEPAASPARAASPSGSSPDEPLDELASLDDEPEDEPPHSAPTLHQYRTQVSLAAQQLLSSAPPPADT